MMAFSRPEFVKRLKGVYTALATPFKDGTVDEHALRRLVERQIEGAVDGLVPVGTTGESPTLSHKEHIGVVRVCVAAAAGRVPILAGTGSNSTQEAIELSEAARDAGADGLLVVSPYYNRPTQRGLLLHYQAIMSRVDLPLVLYNIPSRTGTKVEPETMGELAKSERFVGDKEAAGSTDDVSRILAACGPDFTVMSGDDSMTLPFMSVGARGVISVASNIVPKEMGAMVRAFAAGKTQEALSWHRRLFPLCRTLFIETNPIPVKTAMGMLGLCSADLRLPLAPMEESNVSRLKSALREFGLKV
jgi:4-hydroxy-tetrahydrodipicolinate synthase